MAEENDIPSLQLADFMDIFKGNIHNYGQHEYNFKKEGKEEGKNSTVAGKLLTIEQYKAHLNGKLGLGIVPINDEGNVKFGAIDLDVYDSDMSFFVNAIEQNGFPLVPFKSKSGGLHIYLFMKQAVSAKSLIDILSHLLVLLGLDLYVKHRLNRIIEVFPKQTKATAAGGSWINLPYYNAENTQQGAIRNGKVLTLDEALFYIKQQQKSIAELKQFISDLPNTDGPPCLQTISLLGIMSKNSGRNNFMFSMAVYLKKKEPDFWEQRLFEENEKMIDPLPAEEIEGTIISSLRKKEYTYKCNEAPCTDYCRKSFCKKREFGIGKAGGYFSELEYGIITQIKAYEPYYEWEVKLQGAESFKLLRFKSEADIIGQDRFLQLCMRELSYLPIKIKQSEWYSRVNLAIKEMKVVGVEKEYDTTPIGLFRALLLEFLLERAEAQTTSQILNKRVYHDMRLKAFLFRSGDLSEYLFVTKNFRFFSPGELHGMLKDHKAEQKKIKADNGQQIRVYVITEETVTELSQGKADPYEAKFEKLEDKL